ncbi:MAG: type II toxin-antitoxin system VapC family toxin, partial [Terriglobales bacterium]
GSHHPAGAGTPLIVLDASAVVELLLATPLGAAVEVRLTDPAEGLHAPHLIDLEVAQTLRRLERQHQVTIDGRGPLMPGYAGHPAWARAGPGPGEPKPARASRSKRRRPCASCGLWTSSGIPTRR